MAKKKINKAKLAEKAAEVPISKEMQKGYAIAEKRCNEALQAFLSTKGLPLMALLCRCYLQGVRDKVESSKLKEAPKEQDKGHGPDCSCVGCSLQDFK